MKKNVSENNFYLLHFLLNLNLEILCFRKVCPIFVDPRHSQIHLHRLEMSLINQTNVTFQNTKEIFAMKSS